MLMPIVCDHILCTYHRGEKRNRKTWILCNIGQVDFIGVISAIFFLKRLGGDVDERWSRSTHYVIGAGEACT